MVMPRIGDYSGVRTSRRRLRLGALHVELAHLPFRKTTFEDHVGEKALERHGKKKWRKTVVEVIDRLAAAMESDYVVIGGGNAQELDELPAGSRRGENEQAFTGGFRLWEPEWTTGGLASPSS